MIPDYIKLFYSEHAIPNIYIMITRDTAHTYLNGYNGYSPVWYDMLLVIAAYRTK